MSDLRRVFDRAVRAAEDRSYIAGRVGRVNPDGSVSIDVAGKPNFVYVRVGAEGELGVSIARNTGVPKRKDLPVRMRRENGVLVIYGVDHTNGRLDTFLGHGGLAAVNYHTHRPGSGLEYVVSGQLLEPGLVQPAGGMSVTINPFRYHHNGVWQTWEGGSLDLTPYQPATAGTWAWVLVGVDPETNTAIAAAGSAVSVGLVLELAALDDIDFGGNIPCGAVRVKADDTVITAFDRYADARGWLNQSTVNALVDLSDIDLDTPENGQYLVYNSVTEKWQNVTRVIPVNLHQLAGINYDGVQDGDVLVWVDANSQWEDMPPPWLWADGSTPLSADWDIGAARRIEAEGLRARDSAGLRLEDDAGNAALVADDSRNVGVNVDTPFGRFHAADGNGSVLITSVPTVGIGEVTLIPEGAIEHGVVFLRIITTFTAGVQDGIDMGTTTLTPGTWQEYVVGTGTYRFALSLGGELTVQRVDGSGTASVAIWALWM